MLLALFGKGWAGLVLIGTVWKRQDLEFQKRNDTPGLDLAYHLGGMLLALATIGGLVWWARRPRKPRPLSPPRLGPPPPRSGLKFHAVGVTLAAMALATVVAGLAWLL